MDYFKLGQITAPVGIKGEMRVYPYTDDITRFSAVKTLIVEGEKEARSIEKLRQDKNMLVVKLSGIDDRNSSETYKGKNLLVSKDDFSLDEGVFFADEIIGLKVFDDNGNNVGVVTDILNKPGQDIYEIEKSGGGHFMLPAVREFILEINSEEKYMKVHLIEGISNL